MITRVEEFIVALILHIPDNIWRPIRPEKELEEVFNALKIKMSQFDVKEYIPADIEAS